ncbi:MAG: hypothetical protein J0H68_02670 [Sphingobacteriia bacterium]|nr:hypothetical protein [Sphingobacteriia bacterium]
MSLSSIGKDIQYNIKETFSTNGPLTHIVQSIDLNETFKSIASLIGFTENITITPYLVEQIYLGVKKYKNEGNDLKVLFNSINDFLGLLKFSKSRGITNESYGEKALFSNVCLIVINLYFTKHYTPKQLIKTDNFLEMVLQDLIANNFNKAVIDKFLKLKLDNLIQFEKKFDFSQFTNAKLIQEHANRYFVLCENIDLLQQVNLSASRTINYHFGLLNIYSCTYEKAIHCFKTIVWTHLNDKVTLYSMYYDLIATILNDLDKQQTPNIEDLRMKFNMLYYFLGKAEQKVQLKLIPSVEVIYKFIEEASKQEYTLKQNEYFLSKIFNRNSISFRNIKTNGSSITPNVLNHP